MKALCTRTLLFAFLLVLGTSLVACGNKEETVTAAKTEGAYLDVGPLVYQIQISRQMNPQDVEDHAYLKGVPAAERRLKANEVWFGVFVRVQNDTDKPQVASRDFEITDTVDQTFRPIQLADTNEWAYRGGIVPANGVIPVPDSPSADGVIGGSMLLFKLTLTSLANRPLEFKITSPSGADSATVDLDV